LNRIVMHVGNGGLDWNGRGTGINYIPKNHFLFLGQSISWWGGQRPIVQWREKANNQWMQTKSGIFSRRWKVSSKLPSFDMVNNYNWNSHWHLDIKSYPAIAKAKGLA
jgi:hypothetical protein